MIKVERSKAGANTHQPPGRTAKPDQENVPSLLTSSTVHLHPFSIALWREMCQISRQLHWPTSDHGAREGHGCLGPAAGCRQPDVYPPPLHGLQVPLYRPDYPFAIAITKPGTCCSPSGPSSLRSQTPIDRYTGQELPIAFDAGYRALRRRPIGCRPLPRLRLPPFEKGHSHTAQCPVPSWQTPARPLPHQRPPVRWPPFRHIHYFQLAPSLLPTTHRWIPALRLWLRCLPDDIQPATPTPIAHRPSLITIAIAIAIAVAAFPTLNHHPATPDPLPRHPPLPSLTRDDSIAST